MNRIESYYFIYPPRPERAIHPKYIDTFDNGTFIGEPKLNGDCCTIFTNGHELHIMNRLGGPMKGFTIPRQEILHLHKNRKGWLILVGEFMNMSQRDEGGCLFNKKFVLFDMLGLDGQYLLGTTFMERYHLMNILYGKDREDKPLLTQITDNIYKVVAIENGFKKAFNQIIKYEMYEGLVLKLKNGKLRRGDREKNNTDTQVKFRKPNKKYSY